MTTARLARIGRIERIRARELDVARGELAQATRLVAERVEDHVRIEARWAAQLATIRSNAAMSVSQHEDARAELLALRRSVDRAHAAIVEAQEVERQARERVTAATVELKKIELWGEKIRTQDHLAASRRERIQVDEIAARRTGKAP